MFFHGRANYLREQRLREQTCFGMIRRGGCNWTAVAMDEVLSIFFLKSSRAAQLFENAECGINSLLSRFATQLGQMFIGHGLARGPHSGAQISGFDLP